MSLYSSPSKEVRQEKSPDTGTGGTFTKVAREDSDEAGMTWQLLLG